MAMFDFITKALHRLLPVREVEVPVLNEDLDAAIEWTLRDLGVLVMMLERMSDERYGQNDFYGFLGRHIEEQAIMLHRGWQEERKALEMGRGDIKWLRDF